MRCALRVALKRVAPDTVDTVDSVTCGAVTILKPASEPYNSIAGLLFAVRCRLLHGGRTWTLDAGRWTLDAGRL